MYDRVGLRCGAVAALLPWVTTPVVGCWIVVVVAVGEENAWEREKLRERV